MNWSVFKEGSATYSSEHARTLEVEQVTAAARSGFLASTAVAMSYLKHLMLVCTGVDQRIQLRSLSGIDS